MSIKNCVEELEETKLYRYLLEQDAEYAGRITQFVAKLAPILATTIVHFPLYTRHDAHHGFEVVKRIEAVVDPLCFEANSEKSFNRVELFLLIAGAYAHDLGMTVFPGEEDEIRDRLNLKAVADWQTHKALQVYIRDHHSVRGTAHIQQNADVLRIPRHLINALDAVSKSHNLSIPDLDDQLRIQFSADSQIIDVRQLAVILCIADAIEFSDTRVVEEVLAKLGPKRRPEEVNSYRENMKHACIGSGVAINSDGVIVATGTFDDAEVLAVSHHTFDQIEEWLRGYCDIDRHSTTPRLRVRPERFVRNLNIPSAHFHRLGVRMSKRSVIDLISSNALWSENGVQAIRELIQNAVEACRYRNFYSPKGGDYTPRVHVNFDRVTNSITVEDNGCGMMERVVLENLLTVGNSRSRSPEYARNNYSSIARFGIGFWSVFTIADAVHVETAAFEQLRPSEDPHSLIPGISFEVSLDEARDYTVLEQFERPCGTKISLQLKPDRKLDEIFQNARGTLLCSETPVNFSLDGIDYPIPNSVPDVIDADVFDGRLSLKEEFQLELYNWRGRVEECDVAIGMAYRILNGQASFLCETGVPLSLKLGAYLEPNGGVCGFVVPINPRGLSFEVTRVGRVFANATSPKGFEYTLDRKQLRSNDAFARFNEHIVHLIHESYRGFLNVTGSFNAESIYRLNAESRLNGGNIHDQFTGSELSDAVRSYADLLCFRLYSIEAGKHFSNAQILHVDLSQLRSMPGHVLFMQNRHTAPGPQGRFYSLESESNQALNALYEVAKARLQMQSVGEPVYICEPNRLASMLFDGDPDSGLFFGFNPTFGLITVQYANLSNVRFTEQPTNILREVIGRWTGAIYLRDFQRPDGKTYQFLGRHRVVIKSGSKLSRWLRDLSDRDHIVRLTETITDLQEEAAGYGSAQIKALVYG